MFNTENTLPTCYEEGGAAFAANDPDASLIPAGPILRVVLPSVVPTAASDETPAVPCLITAAERTEETDRTATTNDSGDTRPTIKIIPGELRKTLSLAQHYLARTGKFFERSGSIVRVHHDSLTGETSVKDLNVAELIRALDEVAAWERFDKRAGAWVPIDPPERFCSLLAKAGATEGLQPLAGLARQPYLREDGTLCTLPSHDGISKLYGVFDASKFVMPEMPTRADAEAALARLNGLIEEFPFASGTDRSAALAAILTAAARPSLPQAPMFHVRAHEPGTGKSYLCSVITSFATERAGSPLTYPGSNDECDKVLLAALARSPAVIEFDNLTNDLTPFRKLCTVLTSERVAGRILGTSRTVTVDTRVVLLSSGNNVGPVADMARRCVTINLDAREELPAARTFLRTDLLEELRRNRAAYVVDALTIIRSWILAGEPTTPCKSLSSYGAWSRWCRQPLLWLGCDDPAASVFEAILEDPDRESLGLLLVGWHAKFGSNAVMVRDLVEWASGLDPEGKEFGQVLVEIAGERDKINRRRLGWWLKRHAGQIAQGLRINRAPRKGNAEAWTVVSV